MAALTRAQLATLLLLSSASGPAVAQHQPSQRWSDPAGFRWGVATSAYQIEGATHVDGRLDSIWDVSSRGTRPDGKRYTSRGQSGDTADGSYARYAEDIALMRSLGIKHHRFSIAWPRILPTGRLPANSKGIAHYNRFIDALLHAGITPVVTLYHWALPAALNHGSTPGWLNPTTALRFQDYAKVCFDAFSDRVKTWITFNEALTFVHLGYGSGSHAPNRCSDRRHCVAGA